MIIIAETKDELHKEIQKFTEWLPVYRKRITTKNGFIYRYKMVKNPKFNWETMP